MSRSRGKRPSQSKKGKNNTGQTLITAGMAALGNMAAEHQRERNREKERREREQAARIAEQQRTREKVDDYFSKGNVYSDLPLHTDAAISSYSEAIRLDPKHDAAYHNRGLIYSRSGNYDNAIEDFNRAIKLAPNDANSYNSRGLAFRRSGEYERALQDFDHAIRLDPGFALAISNRKDALDEMRKKHVRKKHVFVADAIERIARLQAKGLLSSDEFQSLKARLLAQDLPISKT